MKKMLLVLLVVMLLVTCNSAGKNSDPNHPDGTGAGGIGTDITKGDMAEVEPMQMTNKAYFSTALSKEVFSNFTASYILSSSGHGDDLLGEIFSMDEFEFYISQHDASNTEWDKVWLKKVGDGEKPYRVCEKSSYHDDNVENYSIEGLNDVSMYKVNKVLRDILTACPNMDKYTFNSDTKSYHYDFNSEEKALLNADYVELVFAGNLVKTAKFGNDSYEEVFNFGYYGTTKIDNWPETFL